MYSVVCFGVRARYCLEVGRCDVQTIVWLCFVVFLHSFGEMEHCGEWVSSHLVLPLLQDSCYFAESGGKNRVPEPKKQEVEDVKAVYARLA